MIDKLATSQVLIKLDNMPFESLLAMVYADLVIRAQAGRRAFTPTSRPGHHSDVAEIVEDTGTRVQPD